MLNLVHLALQPEPHADHEARHHDDDTQPQYVDPGETIGLHGDVAHGRIRLFDSQLNSTGRFFLQAEHQALVHDGVGFDGRHIRLDEIGRSGIGLSTFFGKYGQFRNPGTVDQRKILVVVLVAETSLSTITNPFE